MASEATILKAVRTELGDLPEPFRDSYRGDGSKTEFDLSARNIIESSVRAYTIDPTTAEQTSLYVGQYTIDLTNGLIKFLVPPEQDHLVVVEGSSYGIFSDEELMHFLEAAVGQHLSGRTIDRRYRDGNNFIKYDREKMELEDLPREEEILVTLLATIEAMWALTTDAATDIDVQTAEGTSIPRGQRWRQLIGTIDLLTNKYQELSLLMGVGLYAPEVFNLRRVSRQTGRLVPIFQEREYDEAGPPIRKTPPISTRHAERDGPESPLYGGWA